VSIPGYQELLLPVLRLVADGADHRPTDVIGALADQFELTPAEREEILPSGRGIRVFDNRVHWAATDLRQAGLIDGSRRGIWEISEEGQAVLAEDPTAISRDDLKRFPSFMRFIQRRRPGRGNGTRPEKVDRDSVDDARAVLEYIYEDEDIRNLAVARLVDSISTAERVYPGAWSITLRSTAIRLNVGRIRVLSLRRDNIGLTLDDTALTAASRSAIGEVTDIKQFGSTSVPEAVWVGFPAEVLPTLEPQVSNAHRKIIEIAVERSPRPGYIRSHSPAVVTMLSEDYGIELNDPADHDISRVDIPGFNDLFRPVLESLVSGSPRSIDEVAEDVSDKLELSSEQRALRIPSGSPVVKHRVGWARTGLSRAGLIGQPGPGLLVITPEGSRLLARHSGPIDEDVLLRECPSYANWLADMGGDLPDEERDDEGEPTVWMVRAGEGGRLAPAFVERGEVLMGWGEVTDVSELSRDELSGVVATAMPDARRILRGQATNALFRFANSMRDGDLVITPEPSTRTVLFGRVDGPYRYLAASEAPEQRRDYRHTRPVKWFARVSRDELSYGAQNTTSTAMTLTRPAHEQEFMRLALLHDSDEAPAPLALRARTSVAERAPERVVIPANASIELSEATRSFDTVPKEMVHMLKQLDNGELALPDFQRTFVWEPEATRELIVSMIRSFPAGALLFLEGGAATFKARSVEGAPPLAGRPSHLVLDGQQRLTSLYQALRGVGDSRFFLDLGALLTGAEVNQAVRVLSARRAGIFESLESQARTLMMPLAVIQQRGGPNRWRDQVVAQRHDDDPERVRGLLLDLETSYIDPLVDYKFPVTILPGHTPLEAVCTIFETLNRTGKPLTPFELISARAFAGGHSLYDYWGRALETYPILGDFEVKPYYLLQCIALRMGLSCKRSTVLSVPPDDIAAHWDQTVADMASVLTMLRDECGVLVVKWLSYEPMLIPLTGAWMDVAHATGPTQGSMRSKLKRWFWCASFAGEYESSSASLAERDMPVLRKWLGGGDEPPVVADFGWDKQRWRSVTIRQQGLYKATIALSLVEHPLDFYTGAPLTQEVISAGRIDDHHIFPRGYLEEIGRKDETDCVLNHTLIDRATNIRIGKKAPSVYLREIRASLGGQLDRALASHGLPVGDATCLAKDDFDEFLEWRIDRLSGALEDQVGRVGDVDLDADGGRSEFDGRIEVIELDLRGLVADALSGDIGGLPEHVRVKAQDRIATAIKKNPARADGRYETLEGYLEYCDLRELQDIITSKALWEAFEPLFGTKEALNARFAQLAELRNTLAHTRTMDEVTRKDGEAALLWFKQQLARATADV